MNEIYKKSMEMLYLYLRITKLIPSQNQWNKFALGEGLLFSQTLQYLEGKKFNMMCRKLIKLKEYQNIK